MLDEVDIEEIVRTHYADVFAYCRKRLSTVQDAEDATQEIFARLVTHVNASNRTIKYRALVMTIARNYCIDLYRTKKPTVPLSVDIADGSTANSDIYLVLSALPDSEREILELHYSYGFRINEIGGILGISRFSASRKLKVALSHLREAWDDRCIPPLEGKETHE